MRRFLLPQLNFRVAEPSGAQRPSFIRPEGRATWLGVAACSLLLAGCAASPSPAPESSDATSAESELAEALNCQLMPKTEKTTSVRPVASYECRPDPGKPDGVVSAYAFASESDLQRNLREACAFAQQGVDAGLSPKLFLQDVYQTKDPFDGYELVLIHGTNSDRTAFDAITAVGKAESPITKVGC